MYTHTHTHTHDPPMISYTRITLRGCKLIVFVKLVEPTNSCLYFNNKFYTKAEENALEILAS